MFSLSICFGNTVWALRFKTEEAATAARTRVDLGDNSVFDITDDYGQTATFSGKHICGFMLEDMKKSREAHIDQMIHNATMQTEAQRRIQTAPRGPAIVSPGFPVDMRGAPQR